MLKKVSLYCLFFFVGFCVNPGQCAIKTERLSKIIELTDEHEREKQLLDYFEDYFKRVPLNKLGSSEIEANNLLEQCRLENKLAFEFFIKNICEDRLSHKEEADNALVKAVNAAGKNEDHFLHYIFLNYLAFRQTEEGDATAAIASYRIAKKEAAGLDDIYMQLIININISDVYYKNNYYNQALSYLNEAESMLLRFIKTDKRIKTNADRLQIIIDYNKSEIFFRNNTPDSLKLYAGRLQKAKFPYFKLFTFQNRTLYYLYLINHDDLKAIELIKLMRKNPAYLFDNRDIQNLTDAYFRSNQTDSAVFYVNQLLAEPALEKRPDIKVHLYDILGQIAEKRNDYVSAGLYFKTALQQEEEYNEMLTQVGNISSLIKIDDIESAHNQKDAAFERERIWFVFSIFVAVFIIIIVAIVYWNVRQKRHYENLLYSDTKKDLAFINSHEVRKHLTNILGLVEVIRQSNNKEIEYLEAEYYLFKSAEDLDTAIKNISARLDE